MTVRRLSCCGILLMLTMMTAGCQFWPHELKPHRLYRWNRHSPPSRDPYFSVPTEVPPELDLDTKKTER